MPKTGKRDPLGFLNNYSVAKNLKKGGPLEILVNFEKNVS